MLLQIIETLYEISMFFFLVNLSCVISINVNFYFIFSIFIAIYDDVRLTEVGIQQLLHFASWDQSNWHQEQKVWWYLVTEFTLTTIFFKINFHQFPVYICVNSFHQRKPEISTLSCHIPHAEVEATTFQPIRALDHMGVIYKINNYSCYNYMSLHCKL